MSLSFIDKVQWEAGVLLELAVFVLAIRRKLFQRHPLFTIYLGLLIFDEVVASIISTAFGMRSYVVFYTLWALQCFLILLRGAAVYELCGVLLAPFAGVWKIGRSFLLLIAGVLGVTAYFAASRSGPRISAIISTGERGVELAIIGILLFGLAFCRYYQIQIERYILWIALGFGFYSSVQIVNNTFLGQFLLSYFPLWNRLGVFSFNISTVLWGFALWKPLPVPKFAVAALEPGAYEALAPRMTSGLRSLNARLLELWK
ncbi:MAG TPA: hypothetical protein VGR72_13030 [Candidatus Acidoferrales bacterium]|nr:hypothetical protein [Candidatus Acidoferrales bacterium]